MAADSALKIPTEPWPDASRGACGLCFTNPRPSTGKRSGGGEGRGVNNMQLRRALCFSCLFLSRQLLLALAALASTSQEQDGVEAKPPSQEQAPSVVLLPVPSFARLARELGLSSHQPSYLRGLVAASRLRAVCMSE